MHQLNIALHEGFEDDAVVVLVNGAEVFRHEHVKTRMQIGLAASTAVALAEGVAHLEVKLPVAHTGAVFDVAVTGPTWVGVSLDAARVPQFQLSLTPFGYA